MSEPSPLGFDKDTANARVLQLRAKLEQAERELNRIKNIAGLYCEHHGFVDGCGVVKVEAQLAQAERERDAVDRMFRDVFSDWDTVTPPEGVPLRLFLLRRERKRAQQAECERDELRAKLAQAEADRDVAESRKSAVIRALKERAEQAERERDELRDVAARLYRDFAGYLCEFCEAEEPLWRGEDAEDYLHGREEDVSECECPQIKDLVRLGIVICNVYPRCPKGHDWYGEGCRDCEGEEP
jgi:hypothetical protein